MKGEAVIAVFYYGAGLLFWPVFQAIHRRWSQCARRLFIAFSVTLVVLVGYAILLVVTWQGHGWLPLLLLFPLLNFVSLLASTVICLVSPKHHDT
jgi:hypothetical protein